ncbi:MAG: 23S rRNA (guanosine(2251)-2'-O)-methyltransferase RlmB [Clostridiales bacterium]|nr:23S rRNA (guanosine(2251)-2'-O)-methyltransferase RlmB [Candidatus Crickella caballi]
MSKKENKRFSDSSRSTAPKRGGKNRRDYGDNYEPRKASGSRGAGARGAGSRSAAGRGASGRPARTNAYESLSAEKQYSNIGRDGLEVVAGRNPVMEALKGERGVERVFIAEGSERIEPLVAVAREQGVIVDFVKKDRIEAMAPGEKHQGVVAKVTEYKYASMEDVMEKVKVSGEDPFLIILDEITDPHNLGAIIRTAECAGAHGVIIPKRRACTLTQTVALSAAGAVESMPVVQVTNLARTIEDLKKEGIWIAAADMDGENYQTANLGGPIAIVIGNEGKGVGRLVKEKCDFVLSIPMKGTINSLNASNAAAILMYGVRRCRDI